MPHHQVPRPGLWELFHNGKIELRPLGPSEVTFSSSLVVGSLAAAWIPDSDVCFIDRSLIALTFRMETLGARPQEALNLRKSLHREVSIFTQGSLDLHLGFKD